MKKHILLLGFMFTAFGLMAQSNKLDKKMEKAQDLVDKGKYNDADEYVVKILNDHPEYGSGWDYLRMIRYKEYKDSKQSDNLFSNITVTTKDKDGKDVKGGDSLTNALMDMLSKVKPSKVAFNKYIYTLRLGTLMAEDAHNCSVYIRTNFIDPPVDTAVSKKALKYFNNAEDEFQKKNYDQAAKLYKRALDEQPDFYKASLYLGDCYYAMDNFTDAITSFKAAVERFPNLIEPRKYLADAYLKGKFFSNALDECINSMKVYPESDMVVRMDDAAYLSNKKLDIKWTPRPVFPNKMANKDTSKEELNTYKPDKELEAKGPWIAYQAAMAKIKDNCNEKGIITKTSALTQSPYMEVFAWEEMLKNSTDPSLDEARRMQKDGYLDCYVLVTCFHYDFYDQYLDFATKNGNKITEYYKKYIVPIEAAK